jgi:hypothetical protein
MKKKSGIDGDKRNRSDWERAATPSQPVVRDAAWEAEKRWFEENKSLDPLALFAKYYQRLG